LFRVGIIGCGRIAGGFEGNPGMIFPSTHAGAYSKNEQTKLISVADQNEAELKKFAKKWDITNIYQNYKKMLLNEKFDLISVCTHDESHCEIVLDVINVGIKNIFCEKPLAKNSDEILSMLDSIKKQNVNLILNHSRRWNDNYIYLKEYIKQGNLGLMTSITGSYTSGIRVIGSHMLDIMRFLVGEIIFIKGIKETYQTATKLDYSDNFNLNDPSYSAIMKFENGVVGFLDGSSNKNYLVFEIEIEFQGGKLKLSNNGEKLDIWINYEKKLKKIKNEKIKIRPMMENAVNHIVKVMKEHCNNDICNGEDGLKVIELIECIERE
jgi:predicted dehydrogenase